MDEVPKVSVVLPTYNSAKYLRQSIDSCLNQTYKNIELIIVDDGSTDETPTIVGSYKDQRIKYIRHEKNRGLPTALNTGFSNSEGEYLAWTSDDNQYTPSAIMEMVTCLQNNRGYDFVYSDFWIQRSDSSVKELCQLSDNPDFLKNYNRIACFLYSRRVHESIGDYNDRYALVEDYEYWLRALKQFKFLHHPVPLYIYLSHPDSLTDKKTHIITILSAMVRYQNGHLPLFQLLKIILPSLYRTSYSVMTKKVPYNVFLNDLSRIWLISPLLCFVSLSLLPAYLAFRFFKFACGYFS
jgi:glycosyltransferase involved in cell wall biosynthesis